MMRTHTCGELNEKHDGLSVSLCGWVDSIRTHGGVNFINLRDRFGITQIVFDDDSFKDLRNEYVVQVNGKVRLRPSPNKNIPTGMIEVVKSDLEIINTAEPLPLDISGKIESSDETRLKYRYLDLRNPVKNNYLVYRHKIVQAVRSYLNQNNFIEIETPILVKSTPEGARDYLVPSRVNQGKFYALPQSPQLYKQILMVAGMDRYYQLARCLRDEDLRADRQPEHTQIDLEMSFVTSDDVRNMVEGLIKHVFKEVKGKELDSFPVMSYEDSMNRFGSDKPDMRFGLELRNVTNIVKQSSFNVFKEAEHIVCIVVDKDFSRKQIDKLTDVAKTYKAKGLAYAKIVDNKFDAGISKFLEENIQKQLFDELCLKDNQTVFFVADKKKVALTALGQVRLALRDQFELADKNEFKFAWIKDFPLFAYNDELNKWEPEHHMFSMPKQEFVDDFEKRPRDVLGDLWDLTLNGMEMASGSIRVTNPKIQERIMNFIGFSLEEANQKFGFLLEAYKYGSPVHGGMGIGVDRLTALMLGLNDIREVIAFPKNKNAQCPMDGSPSTITKEQLEELGIKLK